MHVPRAIRDDIEKRIRDECAVLVARTSPLVASIAIERMRHEIHSSFDRLSEGIAQALEEQQEGPGLIVALQVENPCYQGLLRITATKALPHRINRMQGDFPRKEEFPRNIVTCAFKWGFGKRLAAERLIHSLLRDHQDDGSKWFRVDLAEARNTIMMAGGGDRGGYEPW